MYGTKTALIALVDSLCWDLDGNKEPYMKLLRKVNLWM